MVSDQRSDPDYHSRRIILQCPFMSVDASSVNKMRLVQCSLGGAIK